MSENTWKPRHEGCTCGYCRCVHDAGFMGYAKSGCVRYTWPGPGNDLPESHEPTQRYKPRRRARKATQG